jgi:diacylglycerol kinase family enzyme
VIRSEITSCQIESSASVAYQIDGDYGGKLPVKIGILPKRVRLRLPEVRAT